MEEERARKERRNILIKGWKILKKLIKTAVEEVLRKELKVVATRSFLDKKRNKYDNNKTQKQGEEKKNNNRKEELKR